MVLSKSNPITNDGLFPVTQKQFPMAVWLLRVVALEPSSKLRWHYLLSCVGGKRLVIARIQSCYHQHQALLMLPIYTTSRSVFIIHILCGIIAWKRVIFFMVKGRLGLTLGLHLNTRWDKRAAFLNSKHQSCTGGKEMFPSSFNVQFSVFF